MCDDAARQQCDTCHRNTWTVAAFGSTCGMTQPGGQPCTGRFAPIGQG
jgi:hypothetical protein